MAYAHCEFRLSAIMSVVVILVSGRNLACASGKRPDNSILCIIARLRPLLVVLGRAVLSKYVCLAAARVMVGRSFLCIAIVLKALHINM